MTLVGIGTDIVHVPRMARGLERFGERYAERLLTPDELREFRRSARPAQFLAKRFAAKEAFVKALGSGFRAGITWRQVGVGHDPLGRPVLVSLAAAAAQAEALGVTGTFLSLADDGDYAVAYVTLLGGRARPD